MAVKTLKEKIAANLTTQIARSTAKYAVQKELGNRLGVFGQLAGNIYNTATEKADVRAWNTLPSNAQVTRLLLPVGSHTIQLKNNYATYRDWETDRKSTRLNSSHITRSRMPSSA